MASSCSKKKILETFIAYCFHSHSAKDKLEEHEKVCEDHNYCCVEMPKEGSKILRYNHEEKYIKAPFIIYPDLESLLKKMSTCHNNPEKSSATKINGHIPSSYSLFAQCSFYLKNET